MAVRKEELPAVPGWFVLEATTQGPVVHRRPHAIPGCSRVVAVPSHRAPVPAAPVPFNFMYCNAFN